MTQTGHIVFSEMEDVIYGKPAAEAVAQTAERVGAQRVFLMVSGTVRRSTDEIAKVEAALGARCAGLFDAMPPHTPRSAVFEATQMARAADADLIVTIGGGSLTDGGKAVQMCLANDITSVEGMDALRADKEAGVTLCAPAKVRQVSVPTTLSAGEFSALAGVTDERSKTKELFKHPSVVPKTVILDPAVSVHTPQWLWLSTGIRAVDHCVEGICSAEAQPYGDAQATKGLSLFADGLPKVLKDPSDLEARLACQMGAWLSMAPIASGVPMGASHGIGYILGTLFGVPHGHTSCIMLPAVMAWNKPANAERQALISSTMGQPGEEASKVLDAFIGGLGMPRS
ncbi:MAG: iron-containing alcohol dehydrogenase, partial [Pseudomonadota bacterium]